MCDLYFDLFFRLSACSEASISKKNYCVHNIYFHNKIIDDKFTNFPIMPVEYFFLRFDLNDKFKFDSNSIEFVLY